MTKTIKIALILLGFIILIGIKAGFRSNGNEGGILWVIFLMAFLAYTRAIWKYEKKSDNNKLDKRTK